MLTFDDKSVFLW